MIPFLKELITQENKVSKPNSKSNMFQGLLYIRKGRRDSGFLGNASQSGFSVDNKRKQLQFPWERDLLEGKLRAYGGDGNTKEAANRQSKETRQHRGRHPTYRLSGLWYSAVTELFLLITSITR